MVIFPLRINSCQFVAKLQDNANKDPKIPVFRYTRYSTKLKIETYHQHNLFVSTLYKKYLQKIHVDDMSRFSVLCYTECIEKLEFRGLYWHCLVILQLLCNFVIILTVWHLILCINIINFHHQYFRVALLHPTALKSMYHPFFKTPCIAQN